MIDILIILHNLSMFLIFILGYNDKPWLAFTNWLNIVTVMGTTLNYFKSNLKIENNIGDIIEPIVFIISFGYIFINLINFSISKKLIKEIGDKSIINLSFINLSNLQINCIILYIILFITHTLPFIIVYKLRKEEKEEEENKTIISLLLFNLIVVLYILIITPETIISVYILNNTISVFLQQYKFIFYCILGLIITIFNIIIYFYYLLSYFPKIIVLANFILTTCDSIYGYLTLRYDY